MTVFDSQMSHSGLRGFLEDFRRVGKVNVELGDSSLTHLSPYFSSQRCGTKHLTPVSDYS